jgi:muramidase (phage lysozyme)
MVMGDRAKLAEALQNPNVRKMLDLLAHTEGTDRLYGYKTLVGGRRVDDLSKHPNVVGLTTKDGPSTAFGRYQVTGTTWRGLQKQYGFTDISPHTQDLAAVALLKDAGALNAVMKGDFGTAINRSKDHYKPG